MTFQEIRKRIADAYFELSLDGRENLTTRQILNENLPMFIKEGVLVYSRKKLKSEKPITWNFKANIDFDDEHVKESFEKLLHALINSIRISKSSLKTLIFNIISQRIDLLLNPRKALETFYFKEDQTLDTTILSKSLMKIAHDIPFIENLSEKIQGQTTESITRFNFNILVREEIKTFYQDKSKLGVEFSLLFDLFSLDENLSDKGVEWVLVEEFLNSRDLQDAAQIVKKKSTQNKVFWTKADFEDLFSFVLQKKNIEKAPRNGKPFPKIIFTKDDRKFSLAKEKIENQPPGPYPTLSTILDKKDYKLLLKKLFNKDQKAFNNFINKVDSIERWRNAKQLIDVELEKRDLDPYSKEALKLGDIVFAKFHSNGKYMY